MSIVLLINFINGFKTVFFLHYFEILKVYLITTKYFLPDRFSQCSSLLSWNSLCRQVQLWWHMHNINPSNQETEAA